MAMRYDAKSSGTSATSYSSLPTPTPALARAWVMANEQSTDRGSEVRKAWLEADEEEAEDVLARVVSALARAHDDLQARIEEFQSEMRDLGETIPLTADVLEASNEVRAENLALLAQRDEQCKFQTRLLEENTALKKLLQASKNGGAWNRVERAQCCHAYHASMHQLLQEDMERQSKHWFDQATEFWGEAERAWDLIEKERKEKREVEVAYRRLMEKAVDVEEVLRERVAKLRAEVDELRVPMTRGNSWRGMVLAAVLTAVLTAILLSLIR